MQEKEAEQLAERREYQKQLREQRKKAKKLAEEKKAQDDMIMNAETEYASMAEELEATRDIIKRQ